MLKKLFYFYFSIILLSSCGIHKKTSMTSIQNVEFQGHRGCRGLLPENTIPAFIKALDYVQILECDVVISRDKQVIVSHDPWMEAHICSHPDGRPVAETEDKTIKIIELNYEEIKTYDSGIRGHKKFPQQQALATFKPSLKDMVTAVDEHCQKNGISLPWYDIEVKSLASWYDTFTPRPAEYAQLVIAELYALGIEKRCNLQSFDIQLLEEIHKADDQIVTAYLIDNLASFDRNLDKLSFTPDIYSPYYRFVTKKLAKKVHAKGMKLIPWTVNEVKDMRKMIEAGVDGIITDYPNRISGL